MQLSLQCWCCLAWLLVSLLLKVIIQPSKLKQTLQYMMNINGCVLLLQWWHHNLKLNSWHNLKSLGDTVPAWGQWYKKITIRNHNKLTIASELISCKLFTWKPEKSNISAIALYDAFISRKASGFIAVNISYSLNKYTYDITIHIYIWTGWKI